MGERLHLMWLFLRSKKTNFVEFETFTDSEAPTNHEDPTKLEASKWPKPHIKLEVPRILYLQSCIT